MQLTCRSLWHGLLQRSPDMLLIPGTSSVKHLQENLSVAKLQLAAEVIAQLDSIGIATK
jgi:pyridoxine 4-dehydrogenase